MLDDKENLDNHNDCGSTSQSYFYNVFNRRRCKLARIKDYLPSPFAADEDDTFAILDLSIIERNFVIWIHREPFTCSV